MPVNGLPQRIPGCVTSSCRLTAPCLPPAVVSRFSPECLHRRGQQAAPGHQGPWWMLDARLARAPVRGCSRPWVLPGYLLPGLFSAVLRGHWLLDTV